MATLRVFMARARKIMRKKNRFTKKANSHAGTTLSIKDIELANKKKQKN